MIDDLLYTSQMTFHNEKKNPLQRHFLDNEYKEMKPKPNAMETTSFSCRSQAHQPNINPCVNSHVKHHCHDTESQQSNKFATASGLLPVPQLCDDAVTRLHVQLETVDFSAMA